MATNGLNLNAVSAAEAQLARISGQGNARHPHLLALVEGSSPHSARDIADAVHLLCSVHGHHPGLVEQALGLCPAGPAHQWLAGAADAFERERLYLVRRAAYEQAHLRIDAGRGSVPAIVEQLVDWLEA